MRLRKACVGHRWTASKEELDNMSERTGTTTAVREISTSHQASAMEKSI